MNWDTFSTELLNHVIASLNSEAELLDFDDPIVRNLFETEITTWIAETEITCQEDFYDLGDQLERELGNLEINDYDGLPAPTMRWGQELLQFFAENKEACSYALFDFEGSIEESDTRSLHELVVDGVNLELRNRACSEMYRIYQKADLSSLVYDFAEEWAQEHLD